MRQRRVALGACVVVGLVAAGCSSGKPASSATSSTLPPLPPDELALVTEIGSGAAVGSGSSVFGVDLTAGSSSPTRTFATGTFPDAVAITPNGKLALVANYVGNDVTPIDLVTGTVGKSIPAGDGPAGVAVAPDGKTAYVTDAGTSPIGSSVTPINLKTMKAEQPIKVGAGPQGIVISPDGTMAWVADAGAVVAGQSGGVGTTVTPIDLSTGQALAPITVGNAPLALAISPDGSTVWVGNSSSGSVTPISTASRSAGTPISVEGSPQALAVSPDGQTVWVADSSSGVSASSNVTAISTSSGSASAPIAVGKTPTAIALTADGSTVWVVCSGTGTLEPIDASTMKVEGSSSVQVPGGPYAIALFTESSLAAQKTLSAPAKTTKKAKA